eukprot:2249957-Rhodomonas_salina.2
MHICASSGPDVFCPRTFPFVAPQLLSPPLPLPPGASSDLAHFSPGPSLLGGLVLGGCSVAYLVFTGQVLGLSGKIRGM